MGLFKKRTTDPAEIERLKEEIAAMSSRLHDNESAKTELDTTVRDLVTRLNTPSPPPPEPPPPVAPAIDPAELDMLNAKIARLSGRLDEATADAGDPAAEAADAAELEALTSRVDQLTHRLDETPAQPAVSSIDAAELELLDAKMQRIADRIDEIDQRITSISTELANQITELSGDIEMMGGNEPATDEIVGELRDAQTRLASEQARYQIAFRQDLADLADRLKRA